jgi:hypothetical protein
MERVISVGSSSSSAAPPRSFESVSIHVFLLRHTDPSSEFHVVCGRASFVGADPIMGASVIRSEVDLTEW